MTTAQRIHLLFLFSLLFVACENSDNVVVGTLEWDRIEVVNEFSEPIVERLHKEGDALKKGDLILRQDDRRANAELENARALRDQLSAKLDELVAGARQEDIDEAQQVLKQAIAQDKLARLEFARVQKLVARKLASTDDLDKASAEQETSKAQLGVAKARLAKLQAGTRKEEISQARNALQAATAQFERSQLNLERLQIRAPVDGVLDSLPFMAGEQPKSGSVVAVMLAGEQPYASVYVPEQLRASIQPGTKAEIRVDGVNGTFKGNVQTISHDPTFTPYYSLTKSDRSRLAYFAKVYLLEPKARELPAGPPVEVSFDISSAKRNAE